MIPAPNSAAGDHLSKFVHGYPVEHIIVDRIHPVSQQYANFPCDTCRFTARGDTSIMRLRIMPYNVDTAL